MGYDIYFEFHPDRDEADKMMTSLVERNAYDEASWEPYMKLRSSHYFRANIFTMSSLREIMWRCGMLNTVQPPRFPTFEEYGLSGRILQDDPRYVRFEEQCERVRSFTAESPGIPISKVSDNSGWLVTPIEIQSALLEYEKVKPSDLLSIIKSTAENHDWQSPEQLVECWTEWLLFIRRAAELGRGFRVY